MKFKSGKIVMTRTVANMVAEDIDFSDFVLKSLKRHLAGDWGDLDKEDKQENEYSLDKPLRLFSSYHAPLAMRAPHLDGPIKIWIITEANRSVTTILFPDEY